MRLSFSLSRVFSSLALPSRALSPACLLLLAVAMVGQQGLLAVVLAQPTATTLPTLSAPAGSLSAGSPSTGSPSTGSTPVSSTPTRVTGDIRMVVSPIPLDQQLVLPNKTQNITLSLRNVPVRDALRAIAQKAGFNVAVDGSVSNNVSMDLQDVTVEDALEALRTVGKLAYSTTRNTLYVAAETSEKGKTFRQKHMAVIPAKYSSAGLLAKLLNATLFTPPAGSTEGTGGAGAAGGASAGNEGINAPATIAAADPRSNSVIVTGNRSDIETARRHIKQLDIPRQLQTWRLNNANALNVSTMLSASLFNDGIPAITLGSSGGSGGSGSGGAQPASVRVEAETLKDGTGTQQTSSGGGGGGGGGSTTSAGQMPSNITIRDRVKENQTVQINPNGAIILPDTRQNSITVMGTIEQLAMVDRLMRTFDKKAPQVMIEASLVEINKQGLRELRPNVAFNFKKFGYGFNNTQGAPPINSSGFTRAVGLPTSVTSPLENIARFNTAPVVKTFQFAYQINALVRDQKAKILSHPSVLTTHDSESVISIVDEIIRSVTVTLNTGGAGNGATVSTQANIGEAGIVMSILPKIGANNTVSLRIRPTVSNVREVTRDVTGNIITLLSKRELVAQNVTLEDGQSFVLGGLINERGLSNKADIPGLANLPIVGALMRSSLDDNNRSETIVVITPHIIEEEEGSTPSTGPSSAVPVTLPPAQ
jgi:type II secretory pathway component GspD/PulD (secretin)